MPATIHTFPGALLRAREFLLTSYGKSNECAKILENGRRTILWNQFFSNAESVSIINRLGPTEPGSTQPDPTVALFDVLFLGKYKRWECEILTKTSFRSSSCAIKIWKRYLWKFENYALFDNVATSLIFSRFSSLLSTEIHPI